MSTTQELQDNLLRELLVLRIREWEIRPSRLTKSG
jgi:hypothetical protein